MNFKDLMRDTVSVLKSGDGTQVDGIPASVQSDQITILDSTLLIETGDLIIRKMSNGGKETFEVIDPCFHEAFHSIPAGYNAKVKKLGVPEARAAVQSITYHLNGNNARINNNSVDNSINFVNEHSSEVVSLIEKLRAEIKTANLPKAEQAEALEIVDGVESQFSGTQPKRSLIKAMLAALPHIGAVASTAEALISLVS
jgi:hypothetical protein